LDLLARLGAGRRLLDLEAPLVDVEVALALFGNGGGSGIDDGPEEAPGICATAGAAPIESMFGAETEVVVDEERRGDGCAEFDDDDVAAAVVLVVVVLAAERGDVGPLEVGMMWWIAEVTKFFNPCFSCLSACFSALSACFSALSI
jgi:hypothetical protein